MRSEEDIESNPTRRVALHRMQINPARHRKWTWNLRALAFVLAECNSNKRDEKYAHGKHKTTNQHIRKHDRSLSAVPTG